MLLELCVECCAANDGTDLGYEPEYEPLSKIKLGPKEFLMMKEDEEYFINWEECDGCNDPGGERYYVEVMKWGQ